MEAKKSSVESKHSRMKVTSEVSAALIEKCGGADEFPPLIRSTTGLLPTGPAVLSLPSSD
jgi:hypothetical protein